MNAYASDAVVVARLQGSLPDGHLRFLASAAPLRLAWFPQRPTELQGILSNHNATDLEEPEQEEALRLEWGNEVAAIAKILEEIDAHDPTLDQSDPEARLGVGLERRARALSIWDAYGVPLRARAQTVFRILSPRDALGDPIILSAPLSAFLVALSAKTARDATTMSHLAVGRTRWRLLSFTFGAALVALIVGAVLS